MFARDELKALGDSAAILVLHALVSILDKMTCMKTLVCHPEVYYLIERGHQ